MTRPDIPAPAAPAIPAERRRGDPRTILLALVVVLGTVAVLVGGDHLVRVGAQSVVSRAVKKQTGVSEKPSVEVRGRVFLWQAIRGQYDDIEIGLHDLSSGPLRIDTVHASLHGVHLPFHDVLVRDVRSIVVDRSDETALLRYEDLNAYLRTTGRTMTLAAGSRPDEVRLTGTATVLGQPVSASADARLTPAGAALDVSPTSLETGIGNLDQASRLLLGQIFTLRIPLQVLPFGQQLTGLRVGADGVTVQASGTGVLLTP